MKYLVLILVCLVYCCELAAQDREFEVGDRVKGAFLGEKFVGTITQIDGKGVYKINCEMEKGMKTISIYPASALTLVAEGDDLKGDSAPPSSDSTPRSAETRMRELSENFESASRAAEIQKHELREWTDISSKFKIEARFVELSDDQVVLQTADRKRRTIKLGQLSQQDQQFAKGVFGRAKIPNNFSLPSNRENPPSIFEGLSSINNFAFRSRRGNSASLSERLSSQKISRNSVRPVIVPLDGAASKIIGASFTFGCSLDAYLPPSYPKPFAEKVISVGWEDGASCGDLLFGPGRTHCFAVIEFSPMMQEMQKENRYLGFACELSTGNIYGPIATPQTAEKPLAFDGETSSLVTLGSDDRSIHIWKIGEKLSLEPVKEIQLNLQGSILSAQFLDSKHLVVVSSFLVALIDVDTDKTVSQIKFDFLPPAQIAPNGKFVYGKIDGKIAVADMVAGKVVGGCSIDVPDFEPICISPDGKRLAQSSRNNITVWDLEKDKLILDFTVTQKFSGGTTLFITNDLLLVKGRSTLNLISIPLMSEIWSYSFWDCVIAPVAGDGKLVILCNDRSENFTLITTTFPQVQPREIIERLTPDELIVIRPGDSVSLELDTGPMRDRLERMLTTRGIKVSANSELKFKLVRGEVEKFDNRWGWDSDRTKVETVNHWRQPLQLALYKNNKMLWWIDGSIGNVDSDMSIPKGMSFQSFFDGQATTADNFLQQVSLGSYISRRPEGGWYGKSNLVPESKLPK